ncbi:MAG: hypothetical protein ACRELD_08250, partial [Longimicrobiales bacterium]
MRGPSFIPSQHGFPFASHFSIPGQLLGLGAPLSPAFGLCGGMCWAALDRFLAGRAVARDLVPPGPAHPLFLELLQRQANALARSDWARVVTWQRLAAEGGRPGDPGTAELTRREWLKARRSLDAGVPVLLWVVRTSGVFANPSENPQVLAYRYDHDRAARRVSLWVYDPTRPGQDTVRLTFRAGPRGGALEATLAARERVHGFFAVPYDRTLPARIQLDAPIGGAGASALAAGAFVAAEYRSRVHVFGPARGGGIAHHALDGRRAGGRSVPDTARSTEALRPAGQLLALPGSRPTFLTTNPVGELLLFVQRPLLGWGVRSITALRRIGSAFRLDSDAELAMLAHGTTTHVFGTRRGQLLHYSRSWLGRWQANDVSAAGAASERVLIAGKPVARTGRDGALHIFARGVDGELIHYRRHAAQWFAENVSAGLRADRRSRIEGDPLPLIDDRRRIIHVLARDAAGTVLHFRWTAAAGWRLRDLSAESGREGAQLQVGGPLAGAIDSVGVTHVFARGQAGELLHGWCAADGGWRLEDVTGGRAAIPDDMRIDGRPCVLVGPGEALHVIGIGSGSLVAYRWSAYADWIAERITFDQGRPLATDPVLLTSSDRTAHALAVTETGATARLRVLPARPPARLVLARRAFTAAVADAAAAVLALPLSLLTAA